MEVYPITEARGQNGLSPLAKLPAVWSGWFCFHCWLWPFGHGDLKTVLASCSPLQPQMFFQAEAVISKA
jgi:hypothetical protein